jgi:hypothetical protein
MVICRMHRSRRPMSPFVLVALLALAALALGACGDGDGGSKLSPARAERLRSTIDGVEERVNAGDCSGAAAQAQTLVQQANDLPRRIDSDLQNALVEGAARLGELVASECQAAATTEPSATTDTGTTTETVPEEQQEETDPGKQKKEKGPKKQKDPTDVPPGQDGTQPNQTPNGNGGSTDGFDDQQSGGAAP